MKNNNHFAKILLFVILMFSSASVANELIFKTSDITYNDNGNLINASDGIAISAEDNIKIKAKKFQYNKILSTIKAQGDVSVNNSLNKVLIKSENITFNTKTKLIESNTASSIEDTFGNLFLSKNFIYTMNDGLIKMIDVKFIDTEKNIFKFKTAFFNTFSKKFIAKDISIDFDNKSFSEGNEPRLKGNSISLNGENTIVTKGVFTACKKNDGCPPWELSAKEIRHNKKEKRIYYKNALFRIYDVPVFYFPKFFHPGPNAKRQTGFLAPSFSSLSNTGSSLNTPYYWVMADNKDLTLRPRIYTEEKILLQSEYRQANASSNFISDFSFFDETKSESKSHFFSKFEKVLKLNLFEESELDLKLQHTSDDFYLKNYEISSPLISSDSLLNSSIGFKGFNEDLVIETNFQVFENLAKSKTDRYEYVYPDYKFEKVLNNAFASHGRFTIGSSGFIKKYDTNTTEKNIVNDLTFKSNPTFTNTGFVNNYNILLKNYNTDAKNSAIYDNRNKNKLASIAEYNSSFPLKKIGKNYDNILRPLLSFRFSPSQTENIKNDDRRINFDNIFSFDRLSANSTVEGGSSLTYGTEFSKVDKSERKVFSAKIANSVRHKEEKNLPQNSGLWKKTSDIVGGLSFNPSDLLEIDYDFSLNENLSDTTYQKLDTAIRINKLTTTFGYLNESNGNINESYVSNTSTFKVNNNNDLTFDIRKNKETNLTEFYNLIYQYRNDCLIAAIEYNKDYYNAGSLKPKEDIFFKFTVIPFGKTSSPNLK
tara:strand:- start:2005 stop:4299 length:2295 start_codon:yes stop_codon:yes gene_type:complete